MDELEHVVDVRVPARRTVGPCPGRLVVGPLEPDPVPRGHRHERVEHERVAHGPRHDGERGGSREEERRGERSQGEPGPRGPEADGQRSQQERTVDPGQDGQAGEDPGDDRPAEPGPRRGPPGEDRQDRRELERDEQRLGQQARPVGDERRIRRGDGHGQEGRPRSPDPKGEQADEPDHQRAEDRLRDASREPLGPEARDDPVDPREEERVERDPVSRGGFRNEQRVRIVSARGQGDTVPVVVEGLEAGHVAWRCRHQAHPEVQRQEQDDQRSPPGAPRGYPGEHPRWRAPLGWRGSGDRGPP